MVPSWGLSVAQYKTDTLLPLWQDWHIYVLPKYLRSSSSPISIPASLSMATASQYSSLRVGSKNLNGSHGNCLFTVWISVWNLYARKQEQKQNTKQSKNVHFLHPTMILQWQYNFATRGPSCNIKTCFKATSGEILYNPNEMFHGSYRIYFNDIHVSILLLFYSFSKE